MQKISAEDWKKLFALLDDALELPRDRQREWLRSLDSAHSPLEPALRELLAQHEGPETTDFVPQEFLRALPQFTQVDLGMQGAQANRGREIRSGDRVGAYRLDQEIGRGGMGEVWLASRDDGRFEGKCAIKFLDAASASPKLVERFRREGQVLARLTHQNIARLLDAGATGDGRPYLAIEYVNGTRIDRYCDDKALSVGRRVKLFVDVVAAVANAHSQLVIHRDIKPSNVLVMPDGTVKLLDFGIAKLLSADTESAHDGLTRVEDIVLTPEFAAPEQILGEMPSTATDVYQLGMLLFVLLAGRSPAQQLGTRAERIRHAMEGVNPLASEVGRVENRNQLRGDLDAILAKALRKIPAERYATAQAFQDELLRYLNHEAVHARRGATLYAASKFVRRHRVPVGAAILLVIALATGLFAVNRERVVAERRFDQLRTLASKVFELDKSIRGLPGAMSSRQRLVNVSLDYLSGLAKDVGGDIDLSAAIADGYWRVARIQGVPVENNLGDFTKAEQSLAQAEAFSDVVAAARPHDQHALFLAGSIAHDRTILAEQEQRREDAFRHAGKATAMVDRFLSGDSSDTDRDDALRLYTNIGQAYSNLGAYNDALRVLSRVLEHNEPTSDAAKPLRVSATLSLLANVHRYQGDLEAALKDISESRRVAEGIKYVNPDQRMAHLYSIFLREGLILGEDDGVSLGRPDDAIAIFQKAYDLTDTSANSDPKDFSSRSRFMSAARELGKILRHREPERALAVYDAGIKRAKEVPDTVANRRTHAHLLAISSYPLRTLHRDDDASKRLGDAVELLKKNGEFPPKKFALGDAEFIVLCAAADAKIDGNDVQRGIELYRDVMSRLSFDAPNPDPREDLRAAFKMAVVYRVLYGAYLHAGRKDDADEIHGRQAELGDLWAKKLPGNQLALRLRE